MTPEEVDAAEARAVVASEPLMPHMDYRAQVALDRARKDSVRDVPVLARALREAWAEVERMQDGSACDACLRSMAAIEAEVERLARWKTEAMAVLAGWETTWEAVGSPGPLGVPKSEAVRAEVERLRESSNPSDLAENLRLMAKIARVEALCDRAEAETRISLYRHELRAALAGGS